MENNYEIRTSLLLKNSWSYKDIIAYMDSIGNKISVSKALEMKQFAVDNGGALLYKHGHVTVESVLTQLGTTKVMELTYLRLISASDKVADSSGNQKQTIAEKN